MDILYKFVNFLKEKDLPICDRESDPCGVDNGLYELGDDEIHKLVNEFVDKIIIEKKI